jgi:hypothetical protein
VFESVHFNINIQSFFFISLLLLCFFYSFIHLISSFLLLAYSYLITSFRHFTDILFQKNLFESHLRTTWHWRYSQIQKSRTLREIIIVDDVPVTKPPEEHFLHVILFDFPISLHSIRQMIIIRLTYKQWSWVISRISGLFLILVQSILHDVKRRWFSTVH